MKTTAQDRLAALRQEQFLTVLSREEAKARFQAALPMRPLGLEIVPLGESLGRVLAETVRSPIDVPPFDRSSVDGFAVRAEDVAAARDSAPAVLDLNAETIACGHLPRLVVYGGSATPIATGGPIPRGADAVVMVEHTDIDASGGLLVTRPAGPGQNVGFAGSDIARGETLLRRGGLVGSREIGMLAACGIDAVRVYRKPRVAVLSTGDELVRPGEPLRPAAIYDSNGPIIAAAVAENGAEAKVFGAVPDHEDRLQAALEEAIATCDMVILSGGTSKSAGDLTYRCVARLGAPGIVAHGVALKPGKPLCLAVADGKPVVVLPGFPTSAMFTFHDFVVPVLRAISGLAARRDVSVEATASVRVLSDLGRTEFVMVALSQREDGIGAYPLSKGSGAVSSFSQADGFLTVDAMSDRVMEGTRTAVTLFDPAVRVPDLTIMGSHCVGLEAVVDRLAEQGLGVRTVAVGSTGGLNAAKRGECDLAPMHLVDPVTGAYNAPLIGDGVVLVQGWRRMQGLLFRKDDMRFVGLDLGAVIATALADKQCHMVNRNSGAGTRFLIDKLLGSARPPGFWNQPKSHNAVAAAIAQGRADWGVAIAPVAADYDLSFLPIAEEHYDFAVPAGRRARPEVQAFVDALADEAVKDALRALGFVPAYDRTAGDEAP